ncbi:MAG TPA: type I 3-dehydroquinate dehydratase [Fibrobacteria bacterium]|nr:type I 3-dehydroquinate dehydratase [Fibrobacteria bacterium]HOX50206.1 type I 3-dehydroquinate dehydratase [Fibrobacteria bacterium]
MSDFQPMAILVLSRPPQELALTPAARRRVRRVEIRLDLVDPVDWMARCRETERAFPSARLVGTLRRTCDGGQWPEWQSREEAFRKLLAFRGWDMVDLEDDAPDFDALLALLRSKAPDVRHLVSRHRFDPVDSSRMEDEIRQVRDRARRTGAKVAKWAGRLLDPTESGPDLVRLLSAWDGPVQSAVFPIGDGSEPWRVAAALVGGGWAYGHDGAQAVAPGQVSWQVLDCLLGSLPPSAAWDGTWFSGVKSAVELAIRQEAAP